MEKPLNFSFKEPLETLHPAIREVSRTLREQSAQQMSGAIAAGMGDKIREALRMFTDDRIKELAEAGRLRWERGVVATFQTLILDGAPVLVMHDPEFETTTDKFGSVKLTATQRFER